MLIGDLDGHNQPDLIGCREWIGRDCGILVVIGSGRAAARIVSATGLHLGAIAGADFFTVEVLRGFGLVRCYVLFVMDMGSRRIRIAMPIYVERLVVDRR